MERTYVVTLNEMKKGIQATIVYQWILSTLRKTYLILKFLEMSVGRERWKSRTTGILHKIKIKPDCRERNYS